MDVFTALADPGRRSILLHLAGGPARVVDIAAEHRISRPAISKHLRLLTDAGLVTARTSGRERHYRLAEDGLTPVAELLRELCARTEPTRRPRITEDRLDALDLEVRRTVRERDRTDATNESQETA